MHAHEHIAAVRARGDGAEMALEHALGRERLSSARQGLAAIEVRPKPNPTLTLTVTVTVTLTVTLTLTLTLTLT